MRTSYFDHFSDAYGFQQYRWTQGYEPALWMLDDDVVEFAVGTERPGNDWLEMPDEIIKDMLQAQHESYDWERAGEPI